MADDPSHPDALEMDKTSSSTGGLPPDFFEAPESPASEGETQTVAAREEPLPARVVGKSAPTHVVIERRASLPVVLVVVAGNILFFLGGVVAGWAAARKGTVRAEPPATAATDAALGEVVRAIDAKASESSVDALTSRIGEMRSELGTLGRELARLEGRLNARTEPAPAAHAPPPAPDLAPLKTRLDDLVKESRKLAQMPATIEALRRRLDVVDKGVNALQADVAAVPKQLDASLMALKGAMESRPPAPEPVSPADLGRDLGAALFRQGKYAAAREVFLTVGQNYPNDARVWYYAALASGLASGDWTGESVALVRRGIACEQKGSPKRPDIDAQFSALTKEQGKEWLDEWRKGAAP
ncbi:MAG: hypothetical protein ACYC61_31960 [Isosphaeraceae bacterium]